MSGRTVVWAAVVATMLGFFATGCSGSGAAPRRQSTTPAPTTPAPTTPPATTAPPTFADLLLPMPGSARIFCCIPEGPLTLAQAAELLGTGIKEFRTQLTKNHFATGVARQWADSDGSTRVRVMVYKFQTAQDANAFGAFIKDIFDRATAAFESESTVTGIAVSACWATKKRDNNGDFVGAGYGLRGEIVVLLSAWSPDRDAVVVATKGTMLRQYGRLS